MKEFIETLFDENKSFDRMPWWVYAIVCPIGLAFALLIGGTIS